ncbi:MAG: tyrosine-type recombinase/integrase [Kiritimatiellaeota bacterium]|nr:tyrosine-type recombinase/integrase [Kiritimatiellota bacterium]
MKRWDGLVDGYLRLGESLGLGAGTLNQRRNELERLGCWLKRRRPKPNLEQVDGPLLIDYFRARTAFHAKATVASVMSVVRNMGAYLVQQGVWTSNPMRWVRGPRLDPRGKLPRRLGREHLTRLWDATQQNRSVYQQRLSLAVLSLLYGTGLRRGELARLNLADWQREEGLLKIDGRKTGRERSVPVAAGIWRCLEAYLPDRQNMLEQRGVCREPALFLNRRGQRLTAQQLALMVHRLAKTAQVPLVSLHQFRHTCASDLLESGVSLPAVQQMLGHATVVTTTRYLQIADPERARAIRKHPLNDYLGLNVQPTGRPA